VKTIYGSPHVAELCNRKCCYSESEQICEAWRHLFDRAQAGKVNDPQLRRLNRGMEMPACFVH
jgi:hypothetical protein